MNDLYKEKKHAEDGALKKVNEINRYKERKKERKKINVVKSTINTNRMKIKNELHLSGNVVNPFIRRPTRPKILW